jgi:flavin-dependent dehydrogenase
MPSTTPVVTRDQWDAIVVGARVAGASTAMLLAREGMRVLVVDRARRGSDTLSTHALMRGGVLQLRRWGLLDPLRLAGTPPVRRTTFHYGDETVPVSIKPLAGVDALYAPRRPLLDGLLADAAERAGAELRFGTAVSDVVRDDAGRVSGIVLAGRGGAARVERTRLVVGADGRASAVAAKVRAAPLLRGRYATAVAYAYWPLPDPDGYQWYYRPDASAGVIPTNDGLACVFAGGRPETVLPAMRRGKPADAMRRILAAIDPSLADLAAGPPAGAIRVFAGAPALLRRATGPGWALVGDAGWWKDPLSTHGMTDALRDAELLANAVAHGTGSALQSYHRERDLLARSMHDVVDRIASHAWDLDEARLLLRRMASAMADGVQATLALDQPPAA